MAGIVNLLTIADGFGDSWAVPSWYPNYIKWPEIIQLMTRRVNLQNLSRYGAGNEYMIQALKHNLPGKTAVLIQWAKPDRLDLILAHANHYDEEWKQIIQDDKVYHDNVIKIGNDHWWISSDSTAAPVKEYHAKFISYRQHCTRSQSYVDHARLLLKDIDHGFLLTKNSEYLAETIKDHDHWFWHDQFCGMCEFRHVSKYAELDLGITQPIPLIHFDFIRQFIQPKFDLPWRNEREIQAVESMLYRKYKESIPNRPK